MPTPQLLNDIINVLLMVAPAAAVACQVFHQAKPALKVYTLRKRKETLDWINELTRELVQVSAVQTQRQAETARRRAVETW